MAKMKNLVAELVAYESGELTEHEQVGFFAHLYNTGHLSGLQGHYGRTFADHVNNGDFDFVGARAVRGF